MEHLLESKWAPKTPPSKSPVKKASAGLHSSRWSNVGEDKTSCDETSPLLKRIDSGSSRKDSREKHSNTPTKQVKDRSEIPLSQRLEPRIENIGDEPHASPTKGRNRRNLKSSEPSKDEINRAKLVDARERNRSKKLNRPQLDWDKQLPKAPEEELRTIRQSKIPELPRVESKSKERYLKSAAISSISAAAADNPPPSTILTPEEREKLEKQMKDIQNGVFDWADDGDL